MTLDDLQKMQALDSADMIGHINAMPDHIESTWARAQTLPLPDAFQAVQRIVICGMGGSAIGGALAAAAIADVCTVPVMVNRCYDLPAFARGQNTLVIACSHSGGTEETLSAFAQAGERGAQRMVICTGGKLGNVAETAGIPAWTYQYDSQPRAALGFSLALLLALFERLGLAPGLGEQLEEALAVMRAQAGTLRAEAETEANPVKHLAQALAGRIPVILGAGMLVPVARRWMTQLNENAKTWAQFAAMPEMNHNAVVGIDHPSALASTLSVVMLRSTYDSPRSAQRFVETKKLLKKRAGLAVHELQGDGQSRLAQMLDLIQTGDYLSFYLAMLAEVDPTPIEAINLLKESLSKLATSQA